MIKKNATDAIHAKLLSSRSLNPSDASVSITDDENIIEHLLLQNKELKSALEAERKWNNPSGEVKDYINILKEYLQRIEAKVEKMQDNFQEKLNSAGKVNLEKFAELEKKMTDVGDSIRKRSLLSSSSASTSEVPSDIEEKISLGDGVLCSKAAYNKLVHVEESHADWAYALLKGVFGDKAHRMRVRISNKYTENERFPANFLMVAKSLHRDWLGKQTIKDKNGQLHLKYSATEVEKYVNELPAYLADRAYDMQGPRGANARKESGNLNAPERRRSGSTELKRKYRKRGQSLLEMQQFQQLPHSQQPSIQQPLPSQQQQPPHQEPPFQQQLSQTSLQQYQSLDSSDILLSIPEAVAMTVENFETTTTTFTTL